jgi:hypothetical protein
LSDSSTDPKRRDSVEAQLKSWAALRKLQPSAVDFTRLELIRCADAERIATPEGAAELVCALGLNDEGAWEFPEALHAHFGGLRIWQYPEQFGPYLQHVARLGVSSYLEIGIRHGGSFLATVEYLQRRAPLSLAVGVDLIRAPALGAYTEAHPNVQLWWLDSRSEEFKERLAAHGPFDLVFLDSHHEEAQCRAEIELLSRHTRMIALHDITNVGWPDVGRVWREFFAPPEWECVEFTSQYHGLGPFMGIGLAIKRERSV